MKKNIDLPLTLFISLLCLIWIYYSVGVINNYGQFLTFSQEICTRFNIVDTIGTDRVAITVGYIVLMTPFLLMYIVWVLIPRALKKSFRALYHVLTTIAMAPFFLVSIYSIPSMGKAYVTAYSLNQLVVRGCFFTVLIIEVIDLIQNFKKYTNQAQLKKTISKMVALCLIPIFFSIFQFGFLSLMNHYKGEEVAVLINNITAFMPHMIGCVVSLIVIPVAEEIIFRGVIFNNLHKNGPPWFSIPFSAFLWAVWHGSLSSALFYFPLGILLGYVYYHTKLLRYPIMVHSLVKLLFRSSITDVADYVPVIGISYLRRIRAFVFGQSALRALIFVVFAIAAIVFLCWLWVREGNEKKK